MNPGGPVGSKVPKEPDHRRPGCRSGVAEPRVIRHPQRHIIGQIEAAAGEIGLHQGSPRVAALLPEPQRSSNAGCLIIGGRGRGARPPSDVHVGPALSPTMTVRLATAQPIVPGEAVDHETLRCRGSRRQSWSDPAGCGRSGGRPCCGHSHRRQRSAARPRPSLALPRRRASLDARLSAGIRRLLHRPRPGRRPLERAHVVRHLDRALPGGAEPSDAHALPPELSWRRAGAERSTEGPACTQRPGGSVRKWASTPA